MDTEQKKLQNEFIYERRKLLGNSKNIIRFWSIILIVIIGIIIVTIIKSIN